MQNISLKFISHIFKSHKNTFLSNEKGGGRREEEENVIESL